MEDDNAQDQGQETKVSKYTDTDRKIFFGYGVLVLLLAVWAFSLTSGSNDAAPNYSSSASPSPSTSASEYTWDGADRGVTIGNGEDDTDTETPVGNRDATEAATKTETDLRAEAEREEQINKALRSDVNKLVYEIREGLERNPENKQIRLVSGGPLLTSSGTRAVGGGFYVETGEGDFSEHVLSPGAYISIYSHDLVLSQEEQEMAADNELYATETEEGYFIDAWNEESSVYTETNPLRYNSKTGFINE